MHPNLRGSLLMIAAMACFAVEDTLIKSASATLPLAQILMLFGGGGALVFAALARRNDEPLWSPAVAAPVMRWRVLFEVQSRLCYVLAITLTPLSSATAILQATPLVVVATAALLLGERVGPRRWCAILIGLVGVLIIIGPGAEDFSWLSLWAVAGMLGFAGRDLTSRASPPSLSALILGLYGFLSVVLAGVLYGLWTQEPFVPLDAQTGLYMAGAVLAGVLAYSALMTAMRTGDVSAVTPFRYTRLLFGLALGVLVFEETLSPTTLMGCGLVVLSGLFILWRKKAAA
jgi:drug/metabolite transporter (DMT)-like permease